jgi:hypothetical protein
MVSGPPGVMSLDNCAGVPVENGNLMLAVTRHDDSITCTRHLHSETTRHFEWRLLPAKLPRVRFPRLQDGAVSVASVDKDEVASADQQWIGDREL